MIVFHELRGPYGYHAYHGALHREALAEILGYEILDYFSYQVLGLDSHYAGRLTGRWYDAGHDPYDDSAYYELGYRGYEYDDGLALQLFLDGERLAELTDFDRDGEVDLVLVRS